MSYIEYVNSGDSYEDLLPGLAKANDFTIEELAENRIGRISNEQMRKVAGKALKPFHTSGKVLVGWVLLLMIIRTFVPDYILNLATLWFGKKMGGMFLLIMGGTVVAVVTGLMKSTRVTFLLIRDLAEGKAAKAEGRVSASCMEDQGQGSDGLSEDSVARYYYVLKNEYYEVSAQGHEALAAGSPYILYFAPRSKLLLAIEPVRGKPETEDRPSRRSERVARAATAPAAEAMPAAAPIAAIAKTVEPPPPVEPAAKPAPAPAAVPVPEPKVTHDPVTTSLVALAKAVAREQGHSSPETPVTIPVSRTPAPAPAPVSKPKPTTGNSPSLSPLFKAAAGPRQAPLRPQAAMSPMEARPKPQLPKTPLKAGAGARPNAPPASDAPRTGPARPDRKAN